jgi:hypothetical protein
MKPCGNVDWFLSMCGFPRTMLWDLVHIMYSVPLAFVDFNENACLINNAQGLEPLFTGVKLRSNNFDTSPTWSVAHLNFTSATYKTPGTRRHHQTWEKSNTSNHWVFENWKYSNCHELTYRTIWILVKQCVGSHGNTSAL